MALILSIDLGTSNLKVGIVDEQGSVLSSASSETPKSKNESNIEEQNPALLQNLIIFLCKQVLAEVDRREVKYVVSASFQFGLMLLDKDRIPLTGMTLLTDTRSQETFSEFLSVYESESVYEKTGCPLISQYVLPRLFYFDRKESDLLKKARYFSDSKSYLFEWLTGEWVTDKSTAAATQMYNLNNFQWDSDLLSKLQLSPSHFPKVEDGTEYISDLKKEINDILGLNGKVKVVLGIYDGAALGIGLSGLEEEVGMINMGTSAMLRVPGREPIFDKNKNKRIQAYAVQKDLFLNGGAINNAALPLNWIKDNLFHFDIQAPTLLEINRKNPLMSLPYLTGERDSLIGPYASGIFFGIRDNHTKVDFIRSILEGVAFSLRYIYEAFEENNLQIKKIRMAGGGTNIHAWPQMIADVLNLPITLPKEKEMALIGNAILAFRLDGKVSNFKEGSNFLLGKSKEITPHPKSVILRDKQYQFFKKLRNNCGVLYKEYHNFSIDFQKNSK